jgi:hypothetical protein
MDSGHPERDLGTQGFDDLRDDVAAAAGHAA